MHQHEFLHSPGAGSVIDSESLIKDLAFTVAVHTPLHISYKMVLVDTASGRPSVHWKRLVTAIVPSVLAGRGTTEGGRGGRACELRTATFETAT